MARYKFYMMMMMMMTKSHHCSVTEMQEINNNVPTVDCMLTSAT